MTFQVIALQTVWQNIWIANLAARSGAPEEEYSNGGLNWSTDWHSHKRDEQLEGNELRGFNGATYRALRGMP